MLESIRAFFNARKVSRWSLYFVREREGLRYALHNDAVDILLGYVSAPIKKGKRISHDWELHLNFNFEHKSIKLVEPFFLKGNDSRILLDLIATIDPGWMVPRGELVFVDAQTQKQLPLGASDPTALDKASQMTAGPGRLENRPCDNKSARVSLASVLSEVIH
jgi:hypothetical protein